jgi:hypothetical protein
MRYRIVACLSVLLLAGAGLIVGTAQQAGAQSEFTLVGTQTNEVFVPAGGPATDNANTLTRPIQTGDEVIIRQSLSEGGAVVGYDIIICTDTFNDNGLCQAVFAFTGIGDVHGTALVRGLFGAAGGPAVFDGDVDGGTFAYAHASGSVHVVSVSPTQDQYTFAF